MKINLLFSAILLPVSIFAQPGSYQVTGKVIDAVTNAPMQAASVFAENTTMGTTSDINGNFTLSLPNGGYNLVTSFTGYETVSRRITTADADDKSIVITVKQKENALEDVVVRASNEVLDGWEKYGEFFLENFLGRTSNGKECTISNKDVLKFYFYKKRNRLKVLATAPIEMENLALGYKLKYTLDSFTHEYGTQAGIYTGYPLFEEMLARDSLQNNTWQLNRLKAYKGSILHFMRSVYNKSLKAEGFEIQFVAKNDDRETAVRLPDFYGALNYNKDDSTQLVDIIPNQPDIAVLYSKEEPDPGYSAQNEDTPKNFQLSVITIAANESVAIEQNGYYFDQNDITITGYWIWDKVADMVPYDFHP
ncbi:MAG: carboxypeptidase-like regulatory domain-containing protein [Ferruginibacter sp.]|nr:carboxypeptidase-like regulatory domain-containing protein [Ferruginibacter sp.]